MAKLKASDYIDIGSAVQAARVIDGMQNKGKFNDSSIGGVNGVLTSQTLTTISSEIFEFMPPMATFLSLGIQVNKEGGWGNFITSLREDVTGGYELTGNKSKTVGHIGIDGSDSVIQVFGYDAESNYSETDLRQAKMENRNLRTKLFKAHGTKYFEKIDELGYTRLYDSDYERVDSTKLWQDMTNNEKQTFIYNLLAKQRAGKNENYWANVVSVDSEILTDISTTDYSLYKEGSMLNKFQNTWGVKFVGTFRAKKAGSGDTRAMLAFNTNSVRNRIPVSLRFSKTHVKGFHYDFQGMFRLGGADILELSGGIIGDKL